ncbi:hypothetical protein ACL9RJ_11025 [Pseudomonas sp. Mn2068]|uniref:hypothetical protein n=1 Tax=Pseudomonas sp. Mn2068 TaxID=3395265 RepID=UPI003BC95111
MKKHVAHQAILQPFSVLRNIGFSSRCMQRLERYRTEQARRDHAVAVMSWADGTWCALALPSTAPHAVIVDEGQQIEAYEGARSMLSDGLLPLLSLRWEAHA